jgi:hypothetical protein
MRITVISDTHTTWVNPKEDLPGGFNAAYWRYNELGYNKMTFRTFVLGSIHLINTKIKLFIAGS